MSEPRCILRCGQEACKEACQKNQWAKQKRKATSPQPRIPQPPTPVWVSVDKYELREQWYNVFAKCNIGTPHGAWIVTRAYCMPDTRSKWFDADMDMLYIEVTHILDFQ